MSVTPLIFNKNKLQFIADNNGQPYVPDSNITFLDGTSTKKIPDITNGTLYFATKDNENTIKMMVGEKEVDLGLHRAYIFLDDNDKRYAVTGPVDWSEILNKPLNQMLSNIQLDSDNNKILNLFYLDNINDVQSQVSLPFLYSDRNDTMRGQLTIAQDTGAYDNLIIQDETWPIISLQSNAAQDNDGVPITYWIEVPRVDPWQNSNVDLYVGCYSKAMRISPYGSITIPCGQSIGGYLTTDENDNKIRGDIYFHGLANKATADSFNQTITETYFYQAALDGKVLSFLSPADNTKKNPIDLPFVYVAGDTMTGPLGIAASATDGAPKVQLSYNATTESLDFTFT